MSKTNSSNWDSQPCGKKGRAKVTLDGVTVASADSEAIGAKIAAALNGQRHIAPLRRSLERLVDQADDCAESNDFIIVISRQRLAAMKRLIGQAGGKI